MWNFVIG